MKYEIGKSYKTRGGWQAKIESICSDGKRFRAVHYVSDSIMRCSHYDNGLAEWSASERPFPKGWDHPSDITKEEWSE